MPGQRFQTEGRGQIVLQPVLTAQYQRIIMPGKALHGHIRCLAAVLRPGQQQARTGQGDFLPAVLPDGQARAVHAFARMIVDIASVRGVARIDFLANDDELYVNEINTIPGSLAKHLFVDPPLSFAQLLGDLIGVARERPAHRFTSAGADGEVLRKAGSIAAKLS